MDTILLSKVVITIALALLTLRLYSNRAAFFGFWALLLTLTAGYSSWLQFTNLQFGDSPVGQLLSKWEPLRKVIRDANSVAGNRENLTPEELAATLNQLSDNASNHSNLASEQAKQIATTLLGDLTYISGEPIIEAVNQLPKNTQYTQRALKDGVKLLEKNYLKIDVLPGVTATFEHYIPQSDGYETTVRFEGKFDGKTDDCQVINYFWQKSLGYIDAQLGVNGMASCLEPEPSISSTADNTNATNIGTLEP